MGKPTIFNGLFAKTLTRFLRLGGSTPANDVDFLKGSTNPNSTAAAANPGSIYYMQAAEGLFSKLTAGSNTNWKDLTDLPALINDLKADWYLASNWGTGSNATFDGGGAATDTITRSTSANDLIDGVAAWVWTSTTTNDYAVFGPITLPQGKRGRFLKFTFDGYRFNGTSGNVAFRVKDTTNNTIISAASDTFQAYDDQVAFSSRKAVFFVDIPNSCDQIEIGVQNLTGSGSTHLEFNRITIQEAVDSLEAGRVPTQWIYHSSSGLTDKTDYLRFTLSNFVMDGFELITPTDDAGNSRTNFVANFDVTVAITFSAAIDANNTEFQYRDPSGNILMISERLNSTGQGRTIGSAKLKIAQGQSFNIFENGDIDTGNILYMLMAVELDTPEATELKPDSFESTFSAFVENNGTATISSESSPGFISTVNRSAAGTVDIVWGTGLFSVAPTVLAIPEGTSGLDLSIKVGSVTASGCTVYTDSGAALADQDFMLLVTRSGEDYRQSHRTVICPPVKIARIFDSKASTTDGGTFTSGAWQTRTINSDDGDTEIVTISSNQFTLSTGRYFIRANAPAYRVDAHKVKLRDITAGSDAIIGSSAYAGSGDDQATFSYLEGMLALNESTTFELQHRCQTTRATDGFGNASGFTADEIYSEIEIRKVI